MIVAAAEESGSSGGLGVLVFLLFIVVAAVLYVAMSRSMRRMRTNVDRGTFGEPEDASAAGSVPGSAGAEATNPTTFGAVGSERDRPEPPTGL